MGVATLAPVAMTTGEDMGTARVSGPNIENESDFQIDRSR